MSTKRPRCGLLVLVAAGWLGAGCGGDRAPERAPGSALWVAPSSEALGGSDLLALEQAGIGELFVESGEVRWEAGEPSIEPSPAFEVARRIPATLVLSGSWVPSEGDPEEAGRALAGAVGELLLRASDHRMFAVGIHFDAPAPDGTEGRERAIAVLEGLRSGLRTPVALSISVARRQLGAEGLPELAAAADFVVSRVYGQRPQAADRPQAWGIVEATRQLKALEALRTPYLAEVATLGYLVVSDPGGDESVSTRGDLQSLAWNRNLEPGGFALDRGVRQIHSFSVKAPTGTAAGALRPGQEIRIAATATAIVEELVQEIRQDAGPGFRGLVFYRRPAIGEGFGLRAAQLVDAMTPGGTALPQPEVEVEVEDHGDGWWVLKVVLQNRGVEATELGVVDTNWAQIRVPGARITDVDVGSFHRFELYGLGRDGNLYRTLRPDTLRLYAPVLGGGGRLETGEVEVAGWRDGVPQIMTGSAFLAPYGRTVEIGPDVWEPPPPVEEESESEDEEASAP